VERKFPLRVERYALLDDSGGPGRRRGGLGVVTELRLLTDAVMSTGLMRYRFPPWGLFGGGDGAPSATVVNPGAPDERVYHQAGGVRLRAGDVVSHRTGGGGGYGPPRERERELVERDVRDGYVSREAARRTYGYAAAGQHDVAPAEGTGRA
jgi:N-methylhydantoinase B